MSETRSTAGAIQVRESEDGERSVVLHPADDDLFVRTGTQVIGDCRLGISVELWIKEFLGAVEEVRSWSNDRREKIRSCYWAPMGSRVTFFFMPAGAQFDFDLADQLAQLNSDLLSKFNVGAVELHQIPWEEWDRFLSLKTARHVHGDTFTPSDPVAP
jgi:hypothetical protein